VLDGVAQAFQVVIEITRKRCEIFHPREEIQNYISLEGVISANASADRPRLEELRAVPARRIETREAGRDSGESHDNFSRSGSWAYTLGSAAESSKAVRTSILWCNRSRPRNRGTNTAIELE